MLRALLTTFAALASGSMILVATILVGFYLSPEAVRAAEPKRQTTAFSAQITNGIKITYTEAEDQTNPTVLRLHFYPDARR